MSTPIRPIHSILVANRGEIALRVIRACKELGIRSIAICSEADREGLPARTADTVVNIGGRTPAESYLNQDKVMDAARQSEADAIHPGYGFLSENPVFADRVLHDGRIFIGPSAEAIRLLGDKIAAKQLAHRINVPTAGGADGAIETPEQAIGIADRLGYPVLIKAAAGGGGKGMRVVDNAADIVRMVEASQREALGAFGDARVFVEKYVLQPRHIEFQILADAHGNVIHLGERECSVQRRHQKVVEESPSVVLTPALRKEMGQAACALIKEAGYVNAGTVEFLVDKDNRFYFLEVNTRLQVEHPVTEMVTGVDLVHHQIAIARGEALSLTQKDIKQKGWAIECRIMAEDPLNGFLPATGRIKALSLAGGEHVRNDTAMYFGQEITPFYDSMLGKLIVWGKDRAEAISRARGALAEMRVAGIPTSIPFCDYVLRHKDFAEGHYTTQFIADALAAEPLIPPPEVLESAAVAATYAGELETRSMEEKIPAWVGSK